MILFSLPGYENLAAAFPADVQRGEFLVRRFANGEVYVTLSTSVREQSCVVLGTIAPPDENFVSLALLAHTLKKEGARRVTALLPYLGYSRQDKEKPGESLATAWTGACLRASGVDEVLTVDVHSERDRQQYPVPLCSLSPAGLFAEAITRHQLVDATIVAPDNGAIPRCTAVSEALGRSGAPIPYLQKHRDPAGIRHTEMHGAAGERALIIDDILDTGSTLISACEILLQFGTREIFILVTHGLFTGSAWQRLGSLGVQRIFCTDTVPLAQSLISDPRITVLPIGPLLARQFLAAAPIP